MAAEVRVTTDLNALFGGIADNVERIVREELERTAGDVVKAARSQWPRDTGRSGDALRVERHGEGYRVVDDVPYSAFVRRAGSSTLAVDEFVVDPLVRSLTTITVENIARRITEEP